MSWYLTARTIPTRVGRTVDAEVLDVMNADHPHARGENICMFRWPLVQSRTIPTRVGRTMLAEWFEDLITDHPHAGGENVGLGDRTWGIVGPSPRAWGEPA